MLKYSTFLLLKDKKEVFKEISIKETVFYIFLVVKINLFLKHIYDWYINRKML